MGRHTQYHYEQSRTITKHNSILNEDKQMPKKKEVFLFIFAGDQSFRKKLLERFVKPDKKGFVIGLSPIYFAQISIRTKTGKEMQKILKDHLKKLDIV